MVLPSDAVAAAFRERGKSLLRVEDMLLPGATAAMMNARTEDGEQEDGC